MTSQDLTTLLIGDSAAMHTLRKQIVKIAPSQLTVLIQGPTGAGKELVAQAIHKASGRTGRFVPLNASGLSETLFADAMFGHRRGAFTNAIESTKGYVAEAERGTLFLDEIGGLVLANQKTLLRVLEDHSYREVGGNTDRRCDFRAVAATNVPLPRLVKEETFRSDLMYRLHGAIINVPALRDRREDIPQLASFFSRQMHIWQGDMRLSEPALRILQNQDWPGNVRQLKHIIERAAHIADEPVLDHYVIQAALEGEDDTVFIAGAQSRRNELITMLEQCGGDVRELAAYYGKTVSTIYRWLQQQGIPTRERPRRQIPFDDDSRLGASINISR